MRERSSNSLQSSRAILAIHIVEATMLRKFIFLLVAATCLFAGMHQFQFSIIYQIKFLC